MIPALRVAHLTKGYGARPVLTDVSFEVAEGETLVLLGPSGCGKTTLLKCLNRLLEPDGGTIELRGHDVRRQVPAQLRRGIGYVIQQVGLLPHLTVAENVGVVPGLLGWPPARIAARVAELLARLHLAPARFGPLRPAELSGGQQQRVGLARALAAEPPLVLLDEPFGALDPVTRAAVRHDFRHLPELRRTTVVLVTHDVPEAFELADRILLLDQGGIAQLGTPGELLRHPASAFVRDFLAADYLGLALRVATLAELRPWLPVPPLLDSPPFSTAPGPHLSRSNDPPGGLMPHSSDSSGTLGSLMPHSSGSSGTLGVPMPRSSGSSGTPGVPVPPSSGSSGTSGVPMPRSSGSSGTPGVPMPHSSGSSGTSGDLGHVATDRDGGLPAWQGGTASQVALPWPLSIHEALARLTDAPDQGLPLAGTGATVTAGQVLAAFGQAMPILFPASC